MNNVFYLLLMSNASEDANGMANSVDPDQSALEKEQSDEDLHFLPSPICLKRWKLWSVTRNWFLRRTI